MQEFSCYELQIRFNDECDYEVQERLPFTSTSDKQAVQDAKEVMEKDYLPFLKVNKWRVCTLDIGKLVDRVQRNARELYEFTP